MTTPTFDASDFNVARYADLWSDLNSELAKIENSAGLGAALKALQQQQFDQGFIQDDLKAIERSRLIDPTDHTRVFTAQFNPRRALRSNGAGRAIPPLKAKVVNNGCFLCRDNVCWQQRGIEVGYDLKVNGRAYIAWTNPFPLMPVHVTIARKKHESQTWVGDTPADSADRVRRFLSDLLDLTERLPGFIGFYNGDGAGASIPGHFHFQFFKRPEGQEFALEKAAGLAMADLHQHLPLVIRKYPIKTIYFCDSRDKIIEQAGRWVRHWTEFYESDQALSGNIIATVEEPGGEPKRFNLYFVPRNKFYSHAPGIAGLVGGLEVLGEVVFCTEEEKLRLVSGQVDYHSVVRILASVEAPGVGEFLDTIPAA